MSRSIEEHDVLGMAVGMNVTMTSDDAREIADQVGREYCESCHGTARFLIKQLGDEKPNLNKFICDYTNLITAELVELYGCSIDDIGDLNHPHALIAEAIEEMWYNQDATKKCADLLIGTSITVMDTRGEWDNERWIIIETQESGACNTSTGAFISYQWLMSNPNRWKVVQGVCNQTK